MSTANFFFLVSPGDSLHRDFVKECMKHHKEEKFSAVMSSVQRQYKDEKKIVNFSNKVSFNSLNAFEQANLIRTFNIKNKNKKFNLFILGIFDKSILKAVLRRLLNDKESFEDERSILYCACMYGRLYHVNKLLYKKKIYNRSSKSDRRSNKPNPNNIILFIKVILSLEGISFLKKLKFSTFILKIIKYKITFNFFRTIVFIRDCFPFLNLRKKKR